MVIGGSRTNTHERELHVQRRGILFEKRIGASSIDSYEGVLEWV